MRPKDSTCLNFYVPAGKGSRLGRLNLKFSGMLSQDGNLLYLIRLHNVKKKYGIPFLEWIGLPVISTPWWITP